MGKGKRFELTREFTNDLEKLKHYLTNPPLLSIPENEETPLLYLSVSEWAVRSVLVKEIGKKQHLAHYPSKSLFDEETRYTTLEN